MTFARLLCCALVALWGAAFARDQFEARVDGTQLPVLAIETGTEVLDRKGRLLRAFQTSDGRWRLETSVAGVDPRFLNELVRFEDKRFYSHNGIDPLAAGRAIGQAIWAGEVISGASTLTMQVARLLEESGTGSWRGKLRQIRVAFALERDLSKDQILSLYLARAPYGGNIEGLRAASLAYYQKEPRRLNVAERAMLIALPQSPETRRPDLHPKHALEARNGVMTRINSGAVVRQPLRAKRTAFPALAPHLSHRLSKSSVGTTVRTTLSAPVQKKIETLASKRTALGRQDVSIAILVADHTNGEILASVGSAGYRNDARGGFVDMTLALRSPGSTLKPLIYGMAFDQGLIHPETLISDRPAQFGNYAPQNFDGQFRGDIRVREALQMSLNLPVVRLLDHMGPANLMSKLREAKINAKVPGGKAGLAVALGGLGMSLTDLVQLYAVIAQPQKAQILHSIAGQRQPLPSVLSQRAAWYVSDILKGVPRPETAARKEIAFKTGTSYGHRDAWAVGFDGKHVIGVWMGRPDGTPVPGVFGGDQAAPILFEAFDRVKNTKDHLAPPPSDALIVANGDLPAPLRRFSGRVSSENTDETDPKVAFPPDGARVQRLGGDIIVQIRDGIAPFIWMQDGRPVQVNGWDRQRRFTPQGRGFMEVRVIDARGRSTGTTIFAE